MLVLTRKPDQSIVVGSDIEITVLEVRGEQVRLGIRAPRTVTVHRKEVFEQIRQENQSAIATEALPDFTELIIHSSSIPSNSIPSNSIPSNSIPSNSIHTSDTSTPSEISPSE